MSLIRVSLRHAEVAFTTREGGISPAPYDSLNMGSFTGDKPANVEANLNSTRELLGLNRLAFNHQVHGSAITEIGEQPGEPQPADGLITEQCGVGLTVLAADCLPVALAGPDRVAMLHCGWRGLAAELISKAAAIVGGGARLEASIGPGICASHYEVGAELLEKFGSKSPDALKENHLNLRLIARRQLEAAGVAEIADIDRCTFSESDCFFSYRRDGEHTGRQAGIVWRQ